MGNDSQEVTTDTESQKITGTEYKKQGYCLFVWVSPDKLECRCSYVPHQQGAMMTSDELKGYLALSGVKEGILPDALDDFSARSAAGQALTMVKIAAGTPPEAGLDGHVEYTAQPSAVVRSFSDENASVDMHRVLTFINVMPGDEIGRIIPPSPGRPGRNISNQLIPQQTGKPLKLKIGNNVRQDGDGSLLIAGAAGRVCEAGGEISVAEEFVVQGDVNFRVGSIDFNGFVEVRGDVLDGFNITAAKGLRINGNIGASAIRSDGDIAFCGMNGQKKGTIVCGGSITANFIHETDVECAGDVNIEVELHNSQLKSLGKVIVNTGAISGGCCIALGGIETKKAGSAASVMTELYAGIDYRDKDEYEQLLLELEKIGVRMGKARTVSDSDELKKARTALMERVMALRNKTDQRANPKINIKGMLYDNTFLGTGLVAREKVDERSGPFSAIENSLEGGLRFVELTSLDVKAAAIEQVYVREQALRREY
ncbi:MAG: DUF342 domain-containing protein [Desulfuromonadales bacterium]|nr:DUF342 domain-containing protein [Desulfuromonadales bacterium]